MRKIVSAVLALLVTASPAVPATVRLAQVVDTGSGNLREDGTPGWSLGANETYIALRGLVTLVGTNQQTTVAALRSGGNWNAWFLLALGTYDCQGVIGYTDANQIDQVLFSSTIRATLR